MDVRLHVGGAMGTRFACRGLALSIAVVAVWSPGVARACGGFFCNQPPPDGTLPIAQAAENVLFVMDEDPVTEVARVQAHIQILYTGPASKFSWVVPVTSRPMVDVGWDILFDRIEPPTRPSYQVSYSPEGTCKGASSDSVGCGARAGSKATDNGSELGGSGVVSRPTVEVISRGSAGPYDYVVVRSEDGSTLRAWLTTNGYFVSEEAARIVDEYVAGNHAFVAIKLMVGQDTSAIRPIVLTMDAPEACLPLKLTAIAATPDLRINVWVLAGARAVPINYAEIGVNLAKLDWFGFGRNYDQLIKEAANEANGNAFAVEYARGGSTGVAWLTVQDSGRAALALGGADPVAAVGLLNQMGLPPTGAVLQILKKHIPMPASLAAQGVTEANFYTQLRTFWVNNQSSFAPFDGRAFDADLESEIFRPMDRLRPTFQRVPYLTRLATFISPDEMESDPLFVTNAVLPEVAPQHLAVARVLCGDEDYARCTAPVRLEIEDGQKVMFQPTPGACFLYQRGDLDLMPSSDRAWLRDAQAEGTLAVDNRPAIAAAVSRHNAAVNAAIDTGCGCALRGHKPADALLLAFGLLALMTRRRKRS